MQKSELQLLVDDFVLFCFSFSFPSNCFLICSVIPDYYIPVCLIWWGLPQCTFILKEKFICILVLLALLQISIKLRGGGPFSLAVRASKRIMPWLQKKNQMIFLLF